MKEIIQIDMNAQDELQEKLAHAMSGYPIPVACAVAARLCAAQYAEALNVPHGKALCHLVAIALSMADKVPVEVLVSEVREHLLELRNGAHPDAH